MTKFFICFIVCLFSLWSQSVFSNVLNNAVRFEFEGVWQSTKEVNSAYAVQNSVFLGNSGNGVSIIDITMPSSPVLKNTHDYQNATEVIGDGNYMVAVIEGQTIDNKLQKDKILIFDISNDSEQLIAEYQHDSYRSIGDIAISSGTLFFTTSDSLIMVDIQNPYSPVKVGEYDLGTTNLSSPGVTVVGDIVYVAAGTKNLKILDAKSPSDVILLSEYETDMWAVKVAISGKTAFVTGWDGGLVAINVTDPYYPVKVGDYSIESPNIAIDIVVKDSFGFLSYINPDNRDAGIIGLNLHDLSNIEKAGEYTELEWVNDIFILDEYLIVPNKNDLTILKPFLYHKIETDLAVIPTSISIPEGNTGQATIVGGMAPYHVGTSDPSIATALIGENNALKIDAKSQGNVIITITDSTGYQALIQLEVTQMEKVIIVAGSGPYTGNHLWDATLACTEYAYKVLQYQGYTDETIKFLASDSVLDINGDGIFNEVDGNATVNDLKEAITDWALDARDVIIFMLGHGSDNYFRIDQNELLKAAELNTWFNTLEQVMPGKLTFIYDACQSGSFLNYLTSDSGKERILIASASLGENAYFTSLGSLSFSTLFWTQIHNGGNVMDSFLIAKNSIEYTYANQTPLLDDNGNGVANEDDDGTLSLSAFIGNGVVSAGDIPVIGTTSPNRSLNGEDSLVLYADNITDSDSIEKVWAVVTPPGYTNADPDDPILHVPTVELDLMGEERYEGIYTRFGAKGTYNVAFYAKDTQGNISLPKRSTIIQKTESCAIDISHSSISGSQIINSPVTFSVSAQSECKDTLYYRFTMHPDYGTSGYDGRHWTSMTATEYQTDNSCTYTFDKAGKYIVVVWVVTDPVNTSSDGVPIQGWSVDIREDGTCGSAITGASVSGSLEVNQPVSFSVNAHNDCSKELYYRFSCHPYYGTDWYDGAQWTSMTDNEWVSSNTIDYTFATSGKYIVVIWITGEPEDYEAEGIPIIGWSVDIQAKL